MLRYLWMDWRPRARQLDSRERSRLRSLIHNQENLNRQLNLQQIQLENLLIFNPERNLSNSRMEIDSMLKSPPSYEQAITQCVVINESLPPE